MRLVTFIIMQLYVQQSTSSVGSTASREEEIPIPLEKISLVSKICGTSRNIPHSLNTLPRGRRRWKGDAQHQQDAGRARLPLPLSLVSFLHSSLIRAGQKHAECFSLLALGFMQILRTG